MRQKGAALFSVLRRERVWVSWYLPAATKICWRAVLWICCKRRALTQLLWLFSSRYLIYYCVTSTWLELEQPEFHYEPTLLPQHHRLLKQDTSTGWVRHWPVTLTCLCSFIVVFNVSRDKLAPCWILPTQKIIKTCFFLFNDTLIFAETD